MKIKTTILIFMFMGLLNSVYTQVFSSFGIKGGLVLAHLTERKIYRLYETDNLATENRLGVAVGIFEEFFKIKYFSTELEVNYIQKGDNHGGLYSSINVLSIPLKVKFSVPIGKTFCYFSAGPRADIILNKKDVTTQQGYFSNINPVNYGLTVSAGAEIKLSKKNSVILEASYSPDFNISKGHYGNMTDNTYSYRSTSFEFSTGLKFNH